MWQSMNQTCLYLFPLDLDCMGVREVRPIFQDNADEIGNRDFMVLSTSGLTGDGVEEGIDWLVQSIFRNVVERPPAGQED